MLHNNQTNSINPRYLYIIVTKEKKWNSFHNEDLFYFDKIHKHKQCTVKKKLFFIYIFCPHKVNKRKNNTKRSQHY